MKWEYLEVDVYEFSACCGDRFWGSRIEALRELGAEGWELVAMTDGVLVLKRPVAPVEYIIVNAYNGRADDRTRANTEPLNLVALARALGDDI